MKNIRTMTAVLCTTAALLVTAIPVAAATVDVGINIGTPAVYVPPPVYVQPRPVYVQPRYESDWRERQQRAIEWRDNPKNHGQVVSAAAHARNDARKEGKHNGKKGHGKKGHGHGH